LKEKENNLMTKRRSFAALGIALWLLAAIQTGWAQSNDPEVQWQQWAFSIPGSVNPQVGSYGSPANLSPDQCVIGQSGSLWFLAGTTGGTAVRYCTVPDDRQLFFPVINNIFFNSPNCGQGGQNVTASFERNFVRQQMSTVTNLSATLDGTPIHGIENRQSPPFAVVIPPDNFYNFIFPAGPCQSPPDSSPFLAAGVYSPSIDAGFYVHLGPLSDGTHTLHFHAENPPVGFVLDVTYHLTVVPVKM